MHFDLWGLVKFGKFERFKDVHAETVGVNAEVLQSSNVELVHVVLVDGDIGSVAVTLARVN